MLPLVPALILLAPNGAYAPRADLDAGRYLKAHAEAEARLRADPKDALAWATKSQALSAFQRFWEAEQAARQALALQPNLADALLARGLARAGTAVQQRNFGSLKKASGALDDLWAAVGADPRLERGWLSLGLAYQQLPFVLGGSTRRALDCAGRLRAVAPARGDLLEGMVRAMDGDWAKAEPYFGRALALAPRDPEVVYGYLDSLSSKETRRSLGEAVQKARLAAEARRLLPAVSRSAKGVEAVCDALLDAGQPEEAWRVAREALPGVDAPSTVRLQLGKLAARSGLHLQEGLAFLDQALKAPMEGGSGGPPAAHWRRGQILQRLGLALEARAAAREALKLDPKHPGARKLLETLG